MNDLQPFNSKLATLRLSRRVAALLGMDWFKSVQKQAQEAAEKLMQTEAAAKALAMAQQAGQQAKVFAEQAKEVAKEAMQEANKGITGLRQPAEQGPSHDPAQYGITPELVQFAAGLTYTSFSEFPMDTLDLPAAAADQVLTPWQAQHAVLVLKEVPQLQDLRFVLCPRKMDEYLFWSVYFTLCSRYLPPVERQVAPEPSSPSRGHPPPSPAAAAAAGPSQHHTSASNQGAPAPTASGPVSGATPGGGTASTAAAAAGAAAAAAAGGVLLSAGGGTSGKARASTGLQEAAAAVSGTGDVMSSAQQQQQQQVEEGVAGEDDLLPDDDLEELLQNVQVDEGGGSQDEDIGSDLDAYLDDLDAELGEEEET